MSFCLFKILLNDALLKGTVEINEFRFAFLLDVFQLVVHTRCLQIGHRSLL